jgi:hypothetical protein
MDIEEKVDIEIAQPGDSKIEAAELIEQLRQSKKLHDQFAHQFKNQYKIAGKLMADWRDYFKIQLPQDLNPQSCQILGMKLLELHQEASFMKAEAEARVSAYRSASDDQYRKKFGKLVEEYKAPGKKLPSKDTLCALAELDMGNVKNALVHAEIELDFWDEVLDDLSNSRKLIETSTINISVEAKALQHERYLDRLNTKY